MKNIELWQNEIRHADLGWCLKWFIESGLVYDKCHSYYFSKIEN
jgi:hypothetical protein